MRITMDLELRVSLDEQQLRGYERAVGLWHVRGTPLEVYDLTKCPATIKSGWGPNARFIGKQCVRKAGQGTSHVGYGNCMAHGGAKREGRALGGWLMAHQFAQEYDVSPWEALLLVVRITAGRLRYIESVLASASSDAELEGRAGVDGSPLGVSAAGEPVEGRNMSWWVGKSEDERDRLAKVSKAAIDAGVAQLLIEKELRAGEELAGRYVRVLEEMEQAGMDEGSLEMARRVLRSDLQLALSGSDRTVEQQP